MKKILAVVLVLLLILTAGCNKSDESVPGSSSETEVKTDTGAKPETGAEAETGAKPDTEAEAETGAKPDTGAEAETGAKPETGADAETGAKPDTGAENETGVKTNAEAEIDNYAKLIYDEFKDELEAMPLTTSDGGIDYSVYTEDELYEMLGGEGLPDDEFGFDSYFPSFDDSEMKAAYEEIGAGYHAQEIKKFAEGPCEPDGFVIEEIDPELEAELDAMSLEMGDYEDYAAELEELEKQREEAEQALQDAGLDEAIQALEDAKKELEAMGIDIGSFFRK